MRLAQRLAPAAGAQPARRQRLARRRQGLRVEEEKGKNQMIPHYDKLTCYLWSSIQSAVLRIHDILV